MDPKSRLDMKVSKKKMTLLSREKIFEKLEPGLGSRRRWCWTNELMMVPT